MLPINIKIPRTILGLTYTKTYRCNIPADWSDILDAQQRLRFVRFLSLLKQDEAMLHIIKDLLRLSNKQFAQLNPMDIAAISEYLSWMKKSSTYPIIDRFSCDGRVFALPPPDFIGGTAYEFAQAYEYHQDWLNNPQNHKSLLKLVATLARPFSQKYLNKTGDARIPLSNDPKIAEHDIETRARLFESADVAAIVATLKFYDAIKTQIAEYSTEIGIFESNEEVNNDTNKELFGWWTAYRTVAKALLKTEEQVWKMSIWRVLSVMIEEKTKIDDLKRTA